MRETGVQGAGLSHGMMLIAVLLMCAPVASAQTTTQLWGNLTFNWVKSERLVYELDFEPKALLAAPEGEPDWRNLDVTPNVEYSLRPWLDLVADTTVGWTLQTDDVHSTELTPRFGARFHLFSRARQFRVVEQAPRRRIVVRDLVRVESRNFFYSGGDTDSDSTVRFRNRLEFLVPLNKERITDDGARYVLADWEWFVPLDDAEERFANRQRIRTGIGYRRSFNWRYELLYIWTRSRDTIDEGFSTNENIINVRVKRIF
jgi:Protein of unknown function (DUF2490)